MSKWYGEVIGLNNVTTSIGKGIIGLVGPNGAGKSTLMGLAMGQLRPSKGSIRVLGQRPWDNPSVLSQIGYCPEGDPFWAELTGRRFVRFLARVSGLPRGEADSAALRAIELTGMTEHMGRAIRGYSKGMRQRIKIAQALVHEPCLLILDEPFTGTDPVVRHELSALLRRLAADGVDILISSHVLHEVEALTQQILMIDHGRIVAEGDLRTVRRGMHDRPHAIRVRVDEPRRLAAALSMMEAVTGLKVAAADTLVIETTSPEQVYDRLPGLLLEQEMTAREIAAADESLEAVFGYATDRR
ncbi:MAG TPA: ABC transporter ATP-binding protein [Phycisphaerae bacterium]|nr:ABC transporter ATP-binding protein [Phycisphaerae bacterium]